MRLTDRLRRLLALTDHPPDGGYSPTPAHAASSRRVQYTINGQPFSPMDTPEVPAEARLTPEQAQVARTWTSEDLGKFLVETRQ